MTRLLFHVVQQAELHSYYEVNSEVPTAETAVLLAEEQARWPATEGGPARIPLSGTAKMIEVIDHDGYPATETELRAVFGDR